MPDNFEISFSFNGSLSNSEIRDGVISLNLGLFIITGILTCINLAHPNAVQVLIIGYFMLTHGILELLDPIVKTLIAHS